MSKNGTSTRATDKAIQNFFNSPTIRRGFKDGEPVKIEIPRITSVNDCCLEASLESAYVVVARMEVEHGIVVSIKKGAASVLITEQVGGKSVQRNAEADFVGEPDQNEELKDTTTDEDPLEALKDTTTDEDLLEAFKNAMENTEINEGDGEKDLENTDPTPKVADLKKVKSSKKN